MRVLAIHDDAILPQADRERDAELQLQQARQLNKVNR
jgi:hypothetical protein